LEEEKQDVVMAPNFFGIYKKKTILEEKKQDVVMADF